MKYKLSVFDKNLEIEIREIKFSKKEIDDYESIISFFFYKKNKYI